MSKTDKAIFFKKIPYFGKKSENSSKTCFLAFSKNLIYWCGFFTLKMGHNNVLWFWECVCLEKIWFFSYIPRCSQSIRLQDSFIIDIPWWNQSMPFQPVECLCGDNQGKVACKTIAFSWVWPTVLPV